MDEDLKRQFIFWLVGKKGLRPSSASSYLWCVRVFAKTHDLARVTHDNIVKYLADMRLIKQKSVETRRLTKCSLETFYEFYAPLANIPNPTKGLEKIKQYRSFPKLVHPDDVERMCFYQNRRMDDIGRRNSALIAFMALTGVRIGELERIKLGDVEKKQDHFTVLIPSQKGTFSRVLQFGKFIPGTLIDYFARYWVWLQIEKNHAKSNPLFYKVGFRHLHAEDPTSPLLRGSIDYLLNKIAYEAGIDRRISAHQLRHFYATYSIAEGMNLFVLRENMGHARIETTQRYVHIAGLMTNDTLKHSIGAKIKSSPEMGGYTELLKSTFKR